jgi:hypothetical protein
MILTLIFLAQKIEDQNTIFLMYSTSLKMPSKTLAPKQPLRRSARLATKAAAKASIPMHYAIMSSYNDYIIHTSGGASSIRYWELYRGMFYYFWTNMSLFRDNLEYIQDTLNWAIEVTELALHSPVSEETNFMDIAKNVIFRATMALRTKGKYCL